MWKHFDTTVQLPSCSCQASKKFNDFNQLIKIIEIKHPNGSNSTVTKIGCLKLNENVILLDVFVIPEYYVNLICMYKLAKDNIMIVKFNEHNCHIQDFVTKKVLVTGS